MYKLININMANKPQVSNILSVFNLSIALLETYKCNYSVIDMKLQCSYSKLTLLHSISLNGPKCFLLYHILINKNTLYLIFIHFKHLFVNYNHV